jgi:hypothetical protein
MRRRESAALALAVFILVGSVGNAQTRPDFSGDWRPIDQGTSSVPPPTNGGPPPPPRTLSTTVAQTLSELKIARRVESGGREATYNFVYKLDGTESVNQMGPLVFRTRAAWDGAALVLTSAVSAEDNPVGKLREIYRLDNGSLLVETVRETPSGTFTGMTRNEKLPGR